MTQQPRQLLVTCALLYANGPLHLGHLLEHIQADIWIRFQRLQGHHCRFISGEDAHGTPIMLAAERQGITPEELIHRVFIEHDRDLKAFNISFDHFGTTHSQENQDFSTLIYKRLWEKGDITIKTINQAYDPEKQMFLPDRYIKGQCPRCHTPDQYGDNCEHCGATYEALELENPISVLSGANPIPKASGQYFLQLSNYTDFLYHWINSARFSEQTRHKLLEWFKEGLRDLAISREAPYFGFPIPDAPNKYFYVWIDAPIGYMAIFKQLCAKEPALDFETYWKKDSSIELYHTIGKDIVNFHALFWPAMLQGAQFRQPTRLLIHGYLTIEGLKMSKSRGTFITAEKYAQHLDPEYLRYYFASKLNGTIEDIDLNWNDFTRKINSDLVGKVVNIASRCAKLLQQYSHNQLSDSIDAPQLIDQFKTEGEGIASYFESHQYHHAIRSIMTLADSANQYLAQKKPWTMTYTEEEKLELQKICTMGLNLFRFLIIYLKPVLPQLAFKTEQFLNIDPLSWKDSDTVLVGQEINDYSPLMQRVSLEAIQTLQMKD